MTSPFEELSHQLDDLGKKIQSKVSELNKQGVAHGAARQKAVDMEIEHARLAALAKARREGSAHPEQDSILAGEVDALKLSIEKWLAGIDQGY